MNKKSKIDWGSIKIRIVPADKDHPNEGNPYAKLSPKEREKAIVSVSAKIWVRHIRAKSSGKQVVATGEQLPGKDINTVPVKPTEPELTGTPALTPAATD